MPNSNFVSARISPRSRAISRRDLVDGHGEALQLLRLLLADRDDDLVVGDVLVVLPEGRLRGRREHDLGQFGAVLEAGRQPEPADRPLLLVLLEPRSGQVATHDALDRAASPVARTPWRDPRPPWGCARTRHGWGPRPRACGTTTATARSGCVPCRGSSSAGPSRRPRCGRSPRTAVGRRACGRGRAPCRSTGARTRAAGRSRGRRTGVAWLSQDVSRSVGRGVGESVDDDGDPVGNRRAPGCRPRR